MYDNYRRIPQAGSFTCRPIAFTKNRFGNFQLHLCMANFRLYLCRMRNTRFRPVAARSLVARGERSVLALTSRSAAPATQTCEGSSSTGAHRRRASQRRLVGGLLSWTALDLPLLLLFIVVARIGIYQFNQRQIFSAGFFKVD